MKNNTLLKKIRKTVCCAPRSDTACTPLPVAASALNKETRKIFPQSQNDFRSRNTASTQEPLSEKESDILQKAILKNMRV
jgi:hypothetical protein